MRNVARRLEALEQQAQAKGVRIFQQDLDNPSVYFEGDDGPAVSREDISALSAQGWQCVVIEYVEDWRGIDARN